MTVPFPGESVRIQDANDMGDPSGSAALFTDLSVRAGSRTLTAGDEWRFLTYSFGTDYLDDASTPVVVSWVVEIVGGSGTVAVRWGFDPTYGDADAPPPANDGGSHVVTGPTAIVVETTMTADDVLNHPDALAVSLVGTAGAVTVQQVKLRVWPPGGPLGGWATEAFPSFSTDTVTPTTYYTAAQVLAVGSASTDVDAYVAGVALFHAQVPVVAATQERAFGFSSAGGLARTDINLSDPFAPTYDATFLLQSRLVVLAGRDWRDRFPIDDSVFVDGVDWIRPPTEVSGDNASMVQQIGDGSTGWVNATATVQASAGDMPGGPTIESAAGEIPNVAAGGFGSVVFDVPVLHGAAQPLGATVPLDTTGRDILVTFSHSMATDSLVDDVSGEQRLTTLSSTIAAGIGTYATLPPYRPWVLTAAPPYRPLRQWPLDEGNGGTPQRYGRRSTSRRTGHNARGYQ